VWTSLPCILEGHLVELILPTGTGQCNMASCGSGSVRYIMVWIAPESYCSFLGPIKAVQNFLRYPAVTSEYKKIHCFPDSDDPDRCYKSINAHLPRPTENSIAIHSQLLTHGSTDGQMALIT